MCSRLTRHNINLNWLKLLNLIQTEFVFKSIYCNNTNAKFLRKTGVRAELSLPLAACFTPLSLAATLEPLHAQLEYVCRRLAQVTALRHGPNRGPWRPNGGQDGLSYIYLEWSWGFSGQKVFIDWISKLRWTSWKTALKYSIDRTEKTKP